MRRRRLRQPSMVPASAEMYWAVAPCPVSSFTSASPASSSMSIMVTLAPAAANALETPPPMPSAPPVTITDLPSNSPTLVAPFFEIQIINI